jgi:nitrite reductase/ring-hydroxylating ferredoxin subunit
VDNGQGSTHRLSGITPPGPGEAIRVPVNGRAVAIFNVGGKLLAVDADCTHAGGPLEEGVVEGGKVTCPWHGSVFELETGAVEEGPAAEPVRAYSVRTESGDLVLEAR